MDGGCYPIHLRRTVAGAEPRHDGVVEPLRPELGHRLVVRSDSRRVLKYPATAVHLCQSAAGIHRPHPVTRTCAYGPDDAVANMWVIDACYAAAGQPRREPSR